MNKNYLIKILKGIFAIWYREFKVFQREKSRVISSIFLPLFWYFTFGWGIGTVTNIDTNYRHFIFPGFLVMTIIFSSIFNGVYIIWDKKMDFLKEVLIAPLSRNTIFIGKVLGNMTDALLQSYILLIIGIFLKMPYTIKSFILTMLILFIFAAGLVSLGLIIGSFMESPEGFGLVSSFVIYPIFLLSGALYPIERLPQWFKIFVYFNPATYAIDAIRYVIIGKSAINLFIDISVILMVDLFLIILGTFAFNKIKL